VLSYLGSSSPTSSSLPLDLLLYRLFPPAQTRRKMREWRKGEERVEIEGVMTWSS
jgi:hypothetical protein